MTTENLALEIFMPILKPESNFFETFEVMISFKMRLYLSLS